MQRVEFRRCPYCGTPTRRALACRAHSDVGVLDPWNAAEIRLPSTLARLHTSAPTPAADDSAMPDAAGVGMTRVRVLTDDA